MAHEIWMRLLAREASHILLAWLRAPGAPRRGEGPLPGSGAERKRPARNVSYPRRSPERNRAAATTASAAASLRVWEAEGRQWGCNPGRFDDDDAYAPQAPRAAGRCDCAVSG